ncbi:hypothetical protein JTB14_001726 [Gonioctena quinquepunctata]|nr:hypothetical protein JTB14_001726 [Gonioctena quinquepunctata]
MSYLLILLLVPFFKNGVCSKYMGHEIDENDSFDVNIGAGYGFGGGYEPNLPRSTTKITHPTNHISKAFGNEPRVNREMDVQESVQTIVNKKPFTNTWNTDYRNNPYQAKGVINMRDIQNVLHDLDTKSEYSKVLQVVKVPAIYEFHMEKIQKNKDTSQSNGFPVVHPMNEHRLGTAEKHGNIIYRNVKDDLADFARMSSWFTENNGIQNSGRDLNEKTQPFGVSQYESVVPEISYGPKINPNMKNTQNSLPLVYSPEYTTRQRKNNSFKSTKVQNPVSESTKSNLNIIPYNQPQISFGDSNFNAGFFQNPITESSRTIYHILPPRQPQAMFEVAPPIFQNPNNNNPQPPRAVTYSTLSPVLPYDLDANRNPNFSREIQRSGISHPHEDSVNRNGVYKSQIERVSSPDVINVPVEPGETLVTFPRDNHEIGESYSNEYDSARKNCKEISHDNAMDLQDHESSRVENIYLTTGRPGKKIPGSSFRGPKYLPSGTRGPMANRRSGEPLRYYIYINEKYSDEDDKK